MGTSFLESQGPDQDLDPSLDHPAFILKEVPSQPQSPVPRESIEENTENKDTKKKTKKKAQRSDTKPLILEDKSESGEKKDEIIAQSSDESVVVSPRPLVPGYIEKDNPTDSEVESTPDEANISRKEEVKFDKATLIKSINDAANKKVKEKLKDEREKPAGKGKSQTEEDRKKIFSDMKEREAEEIRKVKEEATKKALQEVAEHGIDDRDEHHPQTPRELEQDKVKNQQSQKEEARTKPLAEEEEKAE